MTARGRALLTAVLGFLQLEARSIVGYGTALHGRRSLEALRAWRDNRCGIGLIVNDVARQGYKVSVRQIDVCVATPTSRRLRRRVKRCSARPGRRCVVVDSNDNISSSDPLTKDSVDARGRAADRPRIMRRSAVAFPKGDFPHES